MASRRSSTGKSVKKKRPTKAKKRVGKKLSAKKTKGREKREKREKQILRALRAHQDDGEKQILRALRAHQDDSEKQILRPAEPALIRAKRGGGSAFHTGRRSRSSGPRSLP